jgi:hypothetical protein
LREDRHIQRVRDHRCDLLGPGGDIVISQPSVLLYVTIGHRFGWEVGSRQQCRNAVAVSASRLKLRILTETDLVGAAVAPTSAVGAAVATTTTSSPGLG